MKFLVIRGARRCGKKTIRNALQSVFPMIGIYIVEGYDKSIDDLLKSCQDAIILNLCNYLTRDIIDIRDQVVNALFCYNPAEIENVPQSCISIPVESNHTCDLSRVHARLAQLLDLSPPKIAFLALDIETSGPSPVHHSILSIGWCLGDQDGNVLDNKRIDIKMLKIKGMHPYTLNTFWSEHSKTLDVITKNARHPSDAIYEFLQVLDAFDHVYDLRILTDNPSFDISFINAYVATYAQRIPINYRFGRDNEYRVIIDTDSFNRVFMTQPPSEMWTSDVDVGKCVGVEVSPSDHLPEHDAKRIYELHCGVLKQLLK